MRRVLAHRNGRLYLAGQILSTAGDNALWLAMSVWAKMLTGSSSAAGLTIFAFMTGVLLAPLTGLLADRVWRRPLLVAANLATGAMVCALLLVAGRAQLWIVYLVMFGYGVSRSLLSSAGNSLLAVLLPAEELGEANSVMQMAAQGLRLLSPLLGAGLLVAVGPAPVVLLDVATFVVAAGTVAALRFADPAPAPRESRWRAEMVAGVRHIRATAALRRLAISGVAAACMFGFFETVPYALVGQGLHRSPGFVGVLVSVMGAGALAGGAVAARLMRAVGERALVALGLLASGGSCVLMATAWLPAALAGAALLGVCMVWVNVGLVTLLQRRTPAGLLGRVSAAMDIMMTAPQAASIAAGAALIAVVDFRLLLAVMATVFAAASVYLGFPGRALAGDRAGALSASPEPDRTW